MSTLDPSPPSSRVTITEGVVRAVSADGYTITVATRDGRTLDLQSIVPSVTKGNDTATFPGAGYASTPEPGTIALVTTTSQGESYITGYAYPRYKDSYQGNREKRVPGDQTLRSKSGGFVDVLASGLTRMGSSELAQVLTSHDQGLVRTVCQNYAVENTLGSLLWKVDSDTKKGALNIKCRAGVAESEPSSYLVMGDNQTGSLFEVGTTSGKTTLFSLDRVGNARCEASKDITLSAGSGYVRQQAKKIYLNSGAAKGLNSFKNNFFRLPTLPVLPGQTPSLLKFPELKVMPISLPIPDPKKLLNPVQSLIPAIRLPKVVDSVESAVKSIPKLPKLS